MPSRHRSVLVILAIVSLSASLTVVSAAGAAGPWEGSWRIDTGALTIEWTRGGVKCKTNAWIDVVLFQNGDKVWGTWNNGYHCGAVTAKVDVNDLRGTATNTMPQVGVQAEVVLPPFPISLHLIGGGDKFAGTWNGGNMIGKKFVPPPTKPLIIFKDGKRVK